MKTTSFDEMNHILNLQECMAKNGSHSYTEGSELPPYNRHEQQLCLFPNCQCSNAPTSHATNAEQAISRQINFIRDMRLLLQQESKAEIVIDTQHIGMLLHIEETLIAARLIQKALSK